jgi:Dyp-type peroxidase family
MSIPVSNGTVQPVEAPSDLPLRDSEEIQGNIFAGFNKDHMTFLMLQVKDAPTGRAYLKELMPRIATTKQVATFNEQFSNARRLRGGDDPLNLKAVWVNMSLTQHGLLALAPGLRSDLQNFFSFNAGPANRAQDLRDTGLSAPVNWVFGGPNQAPIDIMLMVAADDEDDLQLELDKQRALASTHGVIVVFEQRGDTLPEERAGHEHFGFKDGISQPGIRGFHPVDPEHPNEREGHPGTEMIAPGEFVLGLEGEINTPLVPDWMVNGSFQVLRRLSQDVPGFWAQVTRQHHSLPANDPMKEDLLASKLVGRWRSGTPLSHAPDQDNRSAQERDRDNDFKYDDDFDGLKTPRFAHIRKMYPRDNNRFGDRTRRILRRGIPFGEPFDPTAGRGHGVDADRGLLFNAYMASIEIQFEFLQQSWANDANFPSSVMGENRTNGPDPIIGEDPAACEIRREDRPDVRLDFRRFVHTTGAVYAFSPSLSTIRKLANGELGQDPGDDVLHVGGNAFITRAENSNWRLRETPGLGGKLVKMLSPGTPLSIIGGPTSKDGLDWWQVRTTDNRQGWVAATGLVTKLN